MASQIIYLATVKHTPKFFLLVLGLSVISCNTSSNKVSNESTLTSDTILGYAEYSEDIDTITIDSVNAEYETNAPVDYGDNFTQTLYVLVSDTGHDYYEVWQKMLDLHHLTSSPIDTMDRYYNTNHNMIMLPDSLEDELYGTYYFMRRYPSNSLSIEYLDHYDTTATETCFALFGGIFSSKKEADSHLKVISSNYKEAYVLTVDMWMGCMH